MSSFAAQLAPHYALTDVRKPAFPHQLPVEKGLSVGAAAQRGKTYRAALQEYGAVLVRDLPFRTSGEFEEIMLAIESDLGTSYFGTAPRNAKTSYVHTTTELPAHFPIPQHAEMSFLKAAPARVFFACLSIHDGEGGETPISDLAAVYRDLDPKVQRKFDRKGVRHIRNYAGPNTPAARFNPWQLKRWDEMFGTNDRDVVEAKCRELDVQFVWQKDDVLRLITEQPATRTRIGDAHPVWFNHAQVFHPNGPHEEYRHIAKSTRQLRYHLLGGVTRALLSGYQLRHAADSMGTFASYGDGEPISATDIRAVSESFWRNTTMFRWQPGDILLLDNTRFGHGRMPFRDDGKNARQIVVAWSNESAEASFVSTIARQEDVAA